MRQLIALFLLAPFTLLLAQKQQIVERTDVDYSNSQLLIVGEGYFTSSIMEEFDIEVGIWSILYLSYFDECDQEVWTKKYRLPNDLDLRHMDLLTESSLMINLSLSDRMLFLEMDLEGALISSKQLLTDVDGCKELYYNYVENNQAKELYVIARTRCSPTKSIFYKLDLGVDEPGIGKTFFHFDSDIHIRYLDDGDLLGQVGEYYFKMSDFGNIKYQKHMTYQGQQELTLASQPLIVENYAYLMAELGDYRIMLVKIDLDNFEEVWTSQVIRMDYPIKANLYHDSDVMLSTHSMGTPTIMIFDDLTGQLVQSRSNSNGFRYSHGQSKLSQGGACFYTNMSDNTRRSNEATYRVIVNPMMDLCETAEEVLLSESNQTLVISDVDTTLFVEDFVFELEQMDEIKTTTLDSNYFSLVCEEIRIEEIEIDTVMDCDSTYVQQDLAPGNYTYQWSDGSVEESRTFISPGTYLASITSCRHDYRLTLEVLDVTCSSVYIPNIVSRSDINNNQFTIGGRRKFTAFDFKVYDRWGGLVFTTEDPDFAWKPDIDLRSGVHVYKISYEFENNGERVNHTGTISIID